MRVFLLLGLLVSGAAWSAAPTKIEKDLRELEVTDPLPRTRLDDRLYTVQMRARPLTSRAEFLLGAGQNFSGSGFLDTKQTSLEGQYHFSDRWALALGYAWVKNEFTPSAQSLRNVTGFLPDVDYASSRLEGRVQYNLFYGKIRFTKLQAISFDQYLGLGAARHELRSGAETGPVADLGFAFWLGRHASAHLGVKDYYYDEHRQMTNGSNHNVHGYAQLGVIF